MLPFDDLAFHEGNVPDEATLASLERELSVRFVDARQYGAFNGTPAHLLRGRARMRMGGYGHGYRHMCRFFAMQWVHALREYEFAMRLDEDVLVHRMEDVLAPLLGEASRVADPTSLPIYGYALRTEEKHTLTCDTLPLWLGHYTASRLTTPSLPPLDVGCRDPSTMYFTNFFVTRVSWWERDEVQSFLRAIDRSGHMFEYRWGDAPIQTAALRLFARIAPVYTAVEYSHLSTENEISSSHNRSQGVEGRFVRPSSVSTTSPSYARFLRLFSGCFAPCAVANRFNLPGAPFDAEPLATRALKQALKAKYDEEEGQLMVEVEQTILESKGRRTGRSALRSAKLF